MPIAVSLALLLFWLVVAYRQYQRGDMLLAAIFLLVGIALAIYRIRRAQGSGQGLAASAGENSNPPGSGSK